MISALPVSGIIFLDKPLGWSSRQAVNEVMRLFSEPGKKRIKAGHGGTLDPLATGMLPILLGEATRYAELGLGADKSYRVTFDLSCQSDTLDREGEVTARFDQSITEEQLLEIMPLFSGPIDQTPPIYSAIRIDGKRAHELARKGDVVEMKSRCVTIHQLKLLSFEFPLVTLEVHCSKGTYIRSLARDIGARLDMGGCVTELRRLSTGGWPESMMVTEQELHEKKEQCLLPLAAWLRNLSPLQLSVDEARRFLQGQRIQLMSTSENEDERDVAVFEGDTLLGTGTLKAGMKHMVVHPARILPSAQDKYR
ncbi:tRNA pseudouridine(55) synthase TruB [Mariprofundus sp. NF]|uniref:tRNA pseudouridine(55) synthase TruB n=1 Tax=Mariprofundus sp. NF TaxID=2608716 RepID=UPI00159FBA17|nr:tRNA pseudouridine(55) synthase TruB [Mariprofundus sp. NF]NWF39301.1 tRNA pseudouridine(55) synthase TruB [Mariprofundus sp. NF]